MIPTEPLPPLLDTPPPPPPPQPDRRNPANATSATPRCTQGKSRGRLTTSFLASVGDGFRRTVRMGWVVRIAVSLGWSVDYKTLGRQQLKPVARIEEIEAVAT